MPDRTHNRHTRTPTQLDESTLSEAEKKNLQSFRDTYKLDDLLDFEGSKGREVWMYM